MALPSETVLNINEILSHILDSIRKIEGTQGLIRCLSVCKLWHDAAAKILYQHVILSKGNMRYFLENRDTEATQNTRSLTIEVLTKETSFDPDTQMYLYEDDSFWDSLPKLPHVVESMKKLSTFSLFVSPKLNHAPREVEATVLRQTVCDILDRLSPSCVNLEIDFRHDNKTQRNETHVARLCSCVRKILPQMRNVHLGIEICSNAFGDWKSPGTEDTEFEPVSCPNLRDLIVLSKGIHCQPGDAKSTSNQGMPELKQSLSRFALQNSSTPTIILQDSARLTDMDDFTLNPIPFIRLDAFLRHNFATNSTLAIPYQVISGDMDYFMRLPQRDIVVKLHTARTLAAGEPWQSSVEGFRFPASLSYGEMEKLGAGNVTLERLGAPPENEYAIRRAKRVCHLWRCETKLNQRLGEAEQREGVDDEATKAIKWPLPDGWTLDDAGYLRQG